MKQTGNEMELCLLTLTIHTLRIYARSLNGLVLYVSVTFLIQWSYFPCIKQDHFCNDIDESVYFPADFHEVSTMLDIYFGMENRVNNVVVYQILPVVYSEHCPSRSMRHWLNQRLKYKNFRSKTTQEGGETFYTAPTKGYQIPACLVARGCIYSFIKTNLNIQVDINEKFNMLLNAIKQVSFNRIRPNTNGRFAIGTRSITA